MDLTDKIRAALDEEERIALAALEGDPARWEARWADRDYVEYEPLVGYLDELGTVAARISAEHAVHIAHQDPKATLDRIAGMREILSIWKVRHGDLSADIPGETICDDWCVRVIGEYVLAALAKMYRIEVET